MTATCNECGAVVTSYVMEVDDNPESDVLAIIGPDRRRITNYPCGHRGGVTITVDG